MKSIRIFVLLFVVCITTYGQNLVQENKIWNVVNCVNGSHCWTESYKINGDTIIDQIEYKKLLRTTDTTLTNWGFDAAIREVDNRTFIKFHNLDSEYLLYDFNLSIGETFSSFYFNCPIELQVQHIDTVTILNGEQREKYTFTNNESWINGIGSLNGLVYVGVYWCEADMFYELSCCFENEEQIFQSDNYENCFISTVGVQENKDLINHTLSPNPFRYSTLLKFDFQSNHKYQLEIIDITGQIIKTVNKITSGEIKINNENMNNGIYVYRLYKDDNNIATGKMIIR